MRSIFSKLYSYRERENKNSIENFLIEIFAYCIDTDHLFRNDFFSKIGLSTVDSVSVQTQSSYANFGRPDIEININNQSTCILIECKVEHEERQNQLRDYTEILLDKSIKNRYLIYLTKYYELKEISNPKICFYCLRWFEICNLITDSNSEITIELKKYLKDENMADSKNFNYEDLVTLRNVTGTISKMDEVLDSTKVYFEKNIGTLSKDSAKSTRMKDAWYSTYSVFSKQGMYYFEIAIGFIWWHDDVHVGTRVYIATTDKYRDSKTYLDLFKKNLKGWEKSDYEDCVVFEDIEPVAKFIIEEEEQIPSMVSYLKNSIDKLSNLKNNHVGIFAK